jgi:ArsR family transcriptional regulator
MDENLRKEIYRLHAQVCSGLAESTRILIIYTLHENNYNVSELAETLDIHQSTISRHLKVLRDCGLVTYRRDGQSVYYSLTDERVIQALDLLRAVMSHTLELHANLVRFDSEALPTDK